MHIQLCIQKKYSTAEKKVLHNYADHKIIYCMIDPENRKENALQNKYI